MRQIMIAGVSSGVGKTTLTLGIMQALRNRSLQVQPYKVGPDYIDTGFHKMVCQRTSINLDEFLVPEDKVLEALYLRALQGVDIGVIEGVMGLYDGFGTDKLYCSSAGMARKLDVPVILVIDGKATSTSAAAVVKGFIDLDPEVNIVGVIVNRVASENHYQLIKTAIERYNSVKVIGYLRKNIVIELPSRHLGLVPDSELNDVDEKINILAKEIESTVDLDELLNLAYKPNELDNENNFYVKQSLAAFESKQIGQGVTIAYALDEAFSFYYPDNLQLLQNIGVELRPFSPMHDERLPEADAYYFGGGFPELFVDELASNHSLIYDIQSAYRSGKLFFAECGGLMYLGDKFRNQDGVEYSMGGLISGVSYMTSRLKRFGYCCYVPYQPTIIADQDWELRGHEFHHSDFESPCHFAGRAYKKRDQVMMKEWESGYASDNLFASYLHVHFYQDSKFIKYGIEQIKQRKNNL